EAVREGGVGVIGAPEGVEMDGAGEVGEAEEHDAVGVAAGGGGGGKAPAGAGGDEAEVREDERALLHDARSEVVAGAGDDDCVVERRADGAGDPNERLVFQIGETRATRARGSG